MEDKRVKSNFRLVVRAVNAKSTHPHVEARLYHHPFMGEEAILEKCPLIMQDRMLEPHVVRLEKNDGEIIIDLRSPEEAIIEQLDAFL